MAKHVPPSIYRIAVANGIEPQFLTNEGNHVTILSPGVVPEIEQEWRVRPGDDGNIIIERPSRIYPCSYLTYEGAPKKPEEHNQVEIRICEIRLNEWKPSPVGPNIFTLRVARSELGIRVAPQKIFPPFLELGEDRLLEWRFERIRSLDESPAE